MPTETFVVEIESLVKGQLPIVATCTPVVSIGEVIGYSVKHGGKKAFIQPHELEWLLESKQYKKI